MTPSSGHEDPALMEQATTAHRAGDHAKAETLYLQMLSVDAANKQVRLLLGMLYANSDREAEAAEILEKVVAEDGANFTALSWLAGVLCTLHRYREAAEMARRALSLRPNDVNTVLHLATAEFGVANFEAAARAFIRVTKLAPGALSAYYGLASTFLKLGDPLKARLVMLDASARSPDTETLIKLAEVCLSCDLAADALEATEKILRRDPQNVEALLLKSRAHRIAQQEVDEDATIEIIVKLAPDDSRSHMHVGRRLQGLGKFEEAEHEFLKSIELNPRQGVAYYGIVSGRRVKPEDAGMVAAMEDLARQDNLSEDDRAHLEYGLGKAYDNLGDYGTAMAHYDEGNRLMRSMRPWTRRFEATVMSDRFERLTKIFTHELIHKPRQAVDRPVEPVIVSGIMRSGTTLMEQILSKHPMIGAAGEQQLWQKAEAECIDFEKGVVDSGRLEGFAKEYCDLLAGIAPGYRVVTEKNPANRTAYGLIHLSFPDTRILHMQRNPVDVAISIYTTMMRTGAAFMGDKEAITFALKMHKRLTEHWAKVLPQDRFRIVSYERLSTEPATVAGEALEFIGLPWADECLSPQTNARTVATPSLWQVRQPVYTSSIDRWRRYEPWLGPFAELIE